MLECRTRELQLDDPRTKVDLVSAVLRTGYILVRNRDKIECQRMRYPTRLSRVGPSGRSVRYPTLLSRVGPSGRSMR